MKKGTKVWLTAGLAAGLVGFMGAGASADHLVGRAEGVDLGPGLGTANAATGGGLEAAAIGQMGDTSFDESTARPLMDLPALDTEIDAQGRIRMDLPGLTLYGPGKAAPEPAAPEGPGKLPVTGANVGDIFALGLAALSGGGVLLRRLRLSLGV